MTDTIRPLTASEVQLRARHDADCGLPPDHPWEAGSVWAQVYLSAHARRVTELAAQRSEAQA